MSEPKTFDELLMEATQSVEQELLAEDKGWIRLGTSGELIDSNTRINNVRQSRWYYLTDPLAKQAIRLWTDYTFGSGMTWNSEEDRTNEVLSEFWDAQANRSVLSAKGQRKSSDKLLVDGEVFFAVFLGSEGKATIRWVDPIEITEIITDPDDIEKVMYYRRQWSTSLGEQKESIYRSFTNIKGESVQISGGGSVSHTEDALIYHLTQNTIGQRGNPLLLPAIDWIKQYRRFLASRVAIMLALARFAWKTKITGGQTAVDAQKAKVDEKLPAAGAWVFENMGSDTQPIRTDSGARNAYEDGRQLKLQVSAAVGIPEQYFGDISIGNLATAKTVELPMMKMFQSYQKVWSDAYDDIDNLILEHNGIPEDKRYVDRDFPPIAPEDVAQVAQSLLAIAQAIPELVDSPDVKQIALMALGINNTAEVLDALSKEAKSDPNVKLAKALREFREVLNNGQKQSMPRLQR